MAAYSSEVWVAAAATQSPAGQKEAARSLGLDGRLRVPPGRAAASWGAIALPGLGNLWTILLKDTSLISTLAVSRPAPRRGRGQPRHATLRPILFYGAAGDDLSSFFSIAAGGRARAIVGTPRSNQAAIA